MNENTQNLIDKIYEEMKTEKGTPTIIPDGRYIGTVTIQPGIVKSESSPNKGCKKYEFQFLITEGEQTGRVVYRNHVIIPSSLSTPPSSESVEYPKWKAAVKAALGEADTLLAKCGVDVSATKQEDLVQEIARHNRQKRKVSFDVKKGKPYINHPLEERIEEDKTSLLYQIPNGQDMPIN